MYNTYQAYGNMLTKTISLSVQAIRENFPVNLASRIIAYYCKEESLSRASCCTGYMNAAGVNATQTTAICEKYNFNNITDVQFFVSDKWFSRNGAAVKSQTNMTQA